MEVPVGFYYFLTVFSWGSSDELYADKLLDIGIFPQSVYDLRKVIISSDF